MGKKVLIRGMIGLPIGISINYVIAAVTSLLWGQGWFSPVVPPFQTAVGSEAAANAVQLLLVALMGFVFGASSCIWDVERWSLLRQSALHFLIIAAAFLAVAWVCCWMEHTPLWLLGYLGIFAAIYAVIWLSISLSIRAKIKAVNQKLHSGEAPPPGKNL